MKKQTALWVLMFVLAWMLAIAPVQAFAQTPAADAATGPAAPAEEHNGSQVTASAGIVLVLNWLKKSNRFKWLSGETPTLNRWVAIGASFLAAIGIHMTFDKTAGVLTVTGLTLTGVLTLAVAWFKSYVFQQTIFNMTKS